MEVIFDYKKIQDGMDMRPDDFAPKHTIINSELFQKGREQLGNLILRNMRTTGGTDVDWLVEHRGGFIILECKEFHEDIIPIPLGQMIAFEKLHERLTSGGKCYFYFFASENITDWKNPDSSIWYFEMNDWKRAKVPAQKSKTGKFYLFEKKSMKEIPINDFRNLMENHWREFEK